MGESETTEKHTIAIEEIRRLLYENAERGFIHPTHSEDMQRFYYLQQGDMRAVELSERDMQSILQGKLSDDPLRNIRYLFIVNTALAARFVVEAGVPLETAYAISDLYIQKADKAATEEEIHQCNVGLFTTYVNMVRKFKRENTYSKPIMLCLNYIDSHFNESITLQKLAEYAEVSPNYLSALFKKETGETLSSYLTRLRTETAKALLTRTSYDYSQISQSLGFCSQSHFTKVFREQTGYSPGEYRRKFFDINISKAH